MQCRDELTDEVERLRVQLAGCLVAAEGNAVRSNDAEPGMYGWSPAFEAVKQLRLKYDAELVAHDETKELVRRLEHDIGEMSQAEHVLRQRLEVANRVILEARTAAELLGSLGDSMGMPRVRLRALTLANLLDEYAALDADIPMEKNDE